MSDDDIGSLPWAVFGLQYYNLMIPTENLSHQNVLDGYGPS